MKSSELKNSKQITIGVCLLSVCFVLFVMVKGFSLIYYNNASNDVIRIVEEVSVKYAGNHGNVALDSLNIKLPEEFIENNIYCDNDTCLNFYLNGDLESSYITISKMSSALDGDNGAFSHVSEGVELLYDFGIVNEAKLLDYYFENSSLPVTIFNSMSKIQVNYVVDNYVNLISVGDEAIKLTDDVVGYMYEGNTNYFIYLYDDNDKYIISLNNRDGGAYFTENTVMDILESIYFR